MTEEEFASKNIEWSRRLEDIMIEMSSFTNYEDLLVPMDPVTKWYRDSIKAMEYSFIRDDAMLIKGNSTDA